MLKKIWFWIKKFYKILKKLFAQNSDIPSIIDTEASIGIINDKIKLLKGIEKDSIDVKSYQKFFNFLEEIGLRKDFDITTTYDESTLYVTLFQPILINSKKNNKIIIFCHGLTNNRWSLFYTMHLSLQRGYQVVCYDARNHGVSKKTFTTLGQIESCDLQDIINWLRKNYQPEKIGLYGFSMGAATCVFWTSYFAGAGNSEVSFAICESPFDHFDTQWERALGEGPSYYWKHFLVNKLIKEFLCSSREKLEKINPYSTLPQNLPIKLLLLHGLEDGVIGWESSFKLYSQVKKNQFNKNKINLYLCCNADHGELPFLGDNIPNSLRWKNKNKNSQYTFTNLFCSYLEKNL
ncbi:MAG: 2-succinyl-6-hydroxy-2,4-cyclohexadiene-1-carboxylate synthase [Mycoplasmataceae bacterium]|nr:MAG: 2-succinyl-6-hydroxy-2,4-cyclohexadiene-1-carboxylate synthase [Mycoplasmataceae bacterium]